MGNFKYLVAVFLFLFVLVEVPAQKGTYTVTKETSLRVLPNIKSAEVISLEKGDVLTSLNNCKIYFCKVNFEGQKGWVIKTAINGELKSGKKKIRKSKDSTLNSFFLENREFFEFVAAILLFFLVYFAIKLFFRVLSKVLKFINSLFTEKQKLNPIVERAEIQKKESNDYGEKILNRLEEKISDDDIPVVKSCFCECGKSFATTRGLNIHKSRCSLFKESAESKEAKAASKKLSHKTKAKKEIKKVEKVIAEKDKKIHKVVITKDKNQEENVSQIETHQILDKDNSNSLKYNGELISLHFINKCTTVINQTVTELNKKDNNREDIELNSLHKSQIIKYLWIYLNQNCEEHYEVNEIITDDEKWDDFTMLRSINSHGNKMNPLKVKGITPFNFMLICEILKITGSGGSPLIDSEEY